MVKETSMWECNCGNVEYGEFPSQECSKCWKINGFVQVPEDMMEQIKEQVLVGIKQEDFDDEEGEELDG